MGFLIVNVVRTGYCPARVRARTLGTLVAGWSAGLALAIASGRALASDDPMTVQPDPAALEGRAVESVEVKLRRGSDPQTPLTDPDEATRQLIENSLRVVPGAPFRGASVTEDIARLNRLGRFGPIESSVTAQRNGTVVVRYVVTVVPVVVDVQVQGNTRIPTADIAERVDLLRGQAVDRVQLDRYVRQIEAMYREKGYATATVSVDDAELEHGIVLFRITEGARVRVTDIRFEGNTAFSAAVLRGEIATQEWTIFNRAPLDEDVLEEDISALIKYYQDRGYLDVEIDRLPPRISPNGREAIVTYVISEGPVYTFRSLRVLYPEQVRETYATPEEARANVRAGEAMLPVGRGQYAVYSTSPLSEAQIAGLMELKPGDVYSVGKLRDSMTAIERAFGVLGFLDVREGSGRIVKSELRDPDDPTRVDVLLQIRPGEQTRVGEVNVTGNSITRHEVIREAVDLRPDRPLDFGALRESEQRLGRLRLFNMDPRTGATPSVVVQDSDPDFPGYRDVLVEVQETSTVEINLGGTVSSDSGFIGRLSYTQRNFDITDFPDSWGEFTSQRAFRGGGQTFRLEALPGSEVQTYLASWSDPTLLGTDYSGSVQASFRAREFSIYEEERASLRMTLGRTFGSRWRGAGFVRFDDVKLSDIDEDAPTDVFALEGRSQLATIGAEISRSTLNNTFTPTEGFRVSFGVEQALGAIGDFDYTKFRLENVVYLPVFRDSIGRATVLSLATEVAWAPQGNDAVPVFERFYRGGRTFRGFEFRTIAPKGIRNDNGEPSDRSVGGSFEFFQGIELIQPVYEEIFFVVGFIDSGTVIDEVGLDDYRVSAGFGFRFVLPALSPAPLALDFGFPLISQDDDEDRFLTFTIDLPF